MTLSSASQAQSISEVKKIFLDVSQHDTIRAEAAIQLADNIYNSDLDSAFQLITKAHHWSQKHNYKNGLSITYGYLGFIYHTQGDFSNGIKEYQASIAFNRTNKFELNLAMDLGNYGMLLSELKDEKAIDFFKESIDIYKRKNQPDDVAYLYSYIGSNFSKNDIYDSAIYYYNQGLNYVTVPSTKANIKRQLAESYFSVNNKEKALNLVNEALEIVSKEDNQTELKLILVTKMNICFKTERFDDAKSCLKQLESLKNVEISRNGSLLYDELKARLEFHFGDPRKAYQLLLETYRKRDQVYNEELIDLVQRKSIEFEYQEKNVRDSIRVAEEQELNNLKYESKLKEEANSRKILWGSIISLLVIVGLIAIGYFKNRQNTKIIEDQNATLEFKNKEIIDSINYAKRIQTVILPSERSMKEVFPKSFVYNRPKAIIGGDFYWLHKKENLCLLAVADCTGHGVPGALLSVVCSEALNRAVVDFRLEDPALILNKVRELIKDHLMGSNEELSDGMDISLIRISDHPEEEGIQMRFSGANSSIFVRTTNGVEIIRGDRQPIGKYFNESSFQNIDLQLHKSDMVFLTTDGYMDQFGGQHGKKMKVTPFMEFLESIQENSISEYESRVAEHFENWMGTEEQVDDVCFLGFQVS